MRGRFQRMKIYRIFVSGVQKELKQERLAVKELVSENILLKEHFTVFLFEEQPAKSKPAGKAYLEEVNKRDVYIGIFGKRYGSVGAQGVSATEREFRQAKEQKKEIFIYLKGKNDSKRDKKLRDLINAIKKPGTGYVYKRFDNIPELKRHIFESLVIFLKEKGVISKFPFDSMICREATYKNIAQELVKNFLENRAAKRKIEIPKISIKNFLIRTIKVVRVEDGILKPTNAGVLFFCDNAEDFIPQSIVKIARFKGTTRIKFIDSQELTGPFYKILDDVESFFRRNTRLASKIVEFKRVDIPEYPFEAIREGVVNAMAHRDYFRRGANIQIDIFDDRIEITNPGGLLPGLDIKHLQGVHETRNKEICKIFHETKDMEKYGTGIGKMNNWMKQHGLKHPVISQPGDFFRITFYGPGDKILDLVSDIPEENMTDLSHLKKRQVKGLEVIYNENMKISRKEYAKRFNISIRSAQRDLRQLLKENLVVQEGLGRGVKYKKP